LQRGFTALLLVLFVAVAVAGFGWVIGIIVSVIVALEYGVIARVGFVQRRVQKLYERHEPRLLRFVKKHTRLLRYIRNVMPDSPVNTQLDSREELEHLITGAHGILSDDEKKLIVHGLTFSDHTAGEVMTPRSVIDSISKKELLGPLVLDDLHKTGHSRFPVIDGDVDHIVGMLYIQNLFALDTKRSVTVEKAMEQKVYYIHENQSLQHALAAFLRTHHHLFVVVNEFRETVGLLSLEDVIEALLGRKIVDEFDAHDDLRKVAERNPRSNNSPATHEDI
jgi:CBS domain containing-hemolysin-like protein